MQLIGFANFSVFFCKLIERNTIQVVFMPDLKAIPMKHVFFLLATEPINPETETSVWWYILPTSGFALLLSFYFIIKRRKKK